jgi:hypothetical protein
MLFLQKLAWVLNTSAGRTSIGSQAIAASRFPYDPCIFIFALFNLCIKLRLVWILTHFKNIFLSPLLHFNIQLSDVSLMKQTTTWDNTKHYFLLSFNTSTNNEFEWITFSQGINNLLKLIWISNLFTKRIIYHSSLHLILQPYTKQRTPFCLQFKLFHNFFRRKKNI